MRKHCHRNIIGETLLTMSAFLRNKKFLVGSKLKFPNYFISQCKLKTADYGLQTADQAQNAD